MASRNNRSVDELEYSIGVLDWLHRGRPCFFSSSPDVDGDRIPE